MSFENIMRLNETDVHRLIKACQVYQDRTGSEYMWDEYYELIEKLKKYQEEYSVAK
jgi:hemerythrin-like domain-containing protein